MNLKNLLKLNKSKVTKGANTRELGRHLDAFPTLLHDSDVYENVYASVRPIVNYFTDLEPYALDIRGEKTISPAVDAIYRPNDKMDFTSFMDAVAVGVLTGDEVNILVWRKDGRRVVPGGRITKDNIAGYTFITKWTTDVYGKRIYERRTANGVENFTDKEVITLVHSRNPHNLGKGYSPSHAARRWTSIDDLIADYQNGHFNNNAVPAGMFIIAGVTATEYEDIVKGIKARHQGAGNNNNIIFSHAPLDPVTGKAAEPKITWVPFSVSNKDLELGTLFDNTNKKIDSSFSVPAVMRGVDSNSTYANAGVSKREFMEGVLRPFAKKIYSQWTHELNRITGGIEAVIKVDVEVPELADELKIKEETRKIRDERVKQYIDLGYSIESINRYLETDDITTLEREVVGQEEQTVSQSDTELAVQEEDKDVVIYRSVEAELRCKDCDRFLGTTKQVEYSDKLKCSNSKCKTLDVPVIKEAANADTLKSKSLTPDQEILYQTQLEATTREFMRQEVDKAIEAVDSGTKATQQEIDEFTDEAMRTIVAILVVSGAIQYQDGIALLFASSLDTSGTSAFNLTDDQIARYRAYLRNVGASYSNDTQASIQKVLDLANVNGWNAAETKAELRKIMELDEYRVKRLARSEMNRSQQMANVYGMEQITGETGINFQKVWNTSRDDACQYCKAMNGTAVPNTETFVPVGGKIEGVDGGVLTNDFVSMETPQGHPNCGCYLTYQVV